MKNLFLSLIVACVLSSPAARAVTLTVTSTADDGSVGTLRSVLGGAADGDTIDFSVTGTITLSATGQLVVDKSVEITGPGANILAIDGNATSRVFYIASGKTVRISGLTITNGSESGNNGGGIYNDHAKLTLSQCTLSGNSAGGGGGGIFSNAQTSSASSIASLTVVNCTISGNSSSEDGGGIFNFGAGFGNATLEIFNSTLSGNSAALARGGGIVNDGGAFGSASLKIVNSTVSGNSAGGGGGGIYSQGLGGMASVNIGNTILNAGPAGANIENTAGTVTSLGYNLSSDGTGPNNGTTDQINTDPKLGPLQDNGGLTLPGLPTRLAAMGRTSVRSSPPARSSPWSIPTTPGTAACARRFWRQT